jgi:hypothetical protein
MKKKNCASIRSFTRRRANTVAVYVGENSGKQKGTDTFDLFG